MDEDRERRQNILNIILIGSIGMLVILDVFVLFHSLESGSAYRGISFEVFSALPAFFIFLYVLSRKGYADIASYFVIAIYLASDSYAVYRWGVMMPIALIAYALIIVMATILRGTKFGFLVTAIIAAFIVPVWYAQFHGLIAVQMQREQNTDAVVFSVLYFLIMTVAWLYDREIQRSLRRARGSEQALTEERDLLEVKVRERTEELRRTQLEKVQQLNRLAELGQLSSGLFHDLLNLLNALSLRADDVADPSLISAFNTTKQIEGFMQAVRKQIGGSDSSESFSLIGGIDHAIQLVNYKANKEHVRISFQYDPHGNIMHYGVPFKFQEVVINLLFNAIESYDGVPRSETQTRMVEVAIKEHDGVATLCVADNGCGMTPTVRARIFEPFFTTKETSKGVGIGLATIKKIIEEELSGAITVQSAPGNGSLFTVTFPIQHERIPKDDRPGTRTREEPTIP